jgi:hypothetical protein
MSGQVKIEFAFSASRIQPSAAAGARPHGGERQRHFRAIRPAKQEERGIQ